MSEVLFTSLTREELSNLIAESVKQFFSTAPPDKDPFTNKYLTRAEVAELLHVSLPTLRKFTVSGKIKSYRVRRRVLYKKEEIDALLK